MSLRRIIVGFLLILGLVLIALLGLGVKQYKLYTNHQAIAEQTETMLFRFMVIREQLIEELFQDDEIDMSGVALALEQFNSSLTAILGNRRIADEYKLGFMQAVDLPGIIILVRRLEVRPEALDVRRNLNRELRILGERLLLFDRLVVEQAKRQLIGFQNVLIGSLLLVLFSSLVAMWQAHRRLVVPLLRDIRHRREIEAAEDRLSLSAPGTTLLPGPAAPGGMIMGIAHEMNDLANGMINYAQVLADELPEQGPQAEIAGKMLESGEQLAGLLKKSIFYSRHASQTDEFLPLAEVLTDGITLGRCALKSAGIQVEVDLPAELPSRPVNACRMQQAVLTIFDHARRALNLRYPTRDGNKRFLIKADVRDHEQSRWLRIQFTDLGGGLTRLEELEKTAELLGAGQPTAGEAGYAGLQELVAQLGGQLRIDTRPGQDTTVTVELPC